MRAEKHEPLLGMDLFTGTGGSVLAGRFNNIRTVVAVELDPFCREVLVRRQDEGEEIIEAFPIWDDIDTFDGTPWNGLIDVIHAGPPCQGWSQAGKQAGELDPRNKWPATARVIGEVRPRVSVLIENVPGIRRYIHRVAEDLSALGYVPTWGVHSARDSGAPHLRKRWWCLAYPDSNPRPQE